MYQTVPISATRSPNLCLTSSQATLAAGKKLRDGPIIYIGQLVEVTETTLVLENADMHDGREGHAGKDAYLSETRRTGVTVNRQRIVVMRPLVISASRLQDVVME